MVSLASSSALILAISSIIASLAFKERFSLSKIFLYSSSSPATSSFKVAICCSNSSLSSTVVFTSWYNSTVSFSWETLFKLLAEFCKSKNASFNALVLASTSSDLAISITSPDTTSDIPIVAAAWNAPAATVAALNPAVTPAVPPVIAVNIAFPADIPFVVILNFIASTVAVFQPIVRVAICLTITAITPAIAIPIIGALEKPSINVLNAPIVVSRKPVSEKDNLTLSQLALKLFIAASVEFKYIS